MNREQIVVNDGERDVVFDLLASFSLEDRSYCFVEDHEDGTSFFLRYFADGDDMVFAALESEQELDEVSEAFEELNRTKIEKEEEEENR